MNRGEDDAALTALLRAAQDSASCSDSLAIARLCISLGHLAAIQFNYDDYIKNNLHAANIYHQSHNELCEMQCVGRALDGAATIADKDLIDSILIEYGSAIPKYFDEIEYLPNAMLVAYIVSKPDGELKELLIEVDSLQNKSSETLLDLSMGWTRLGDANKALSYLPPLDNIHSASDSLKYKGIRNDILELSGNDKQLLSGYKEILINFEDFVNVRFRDSIMFTAQKFEIESQAEKKLLKKERSKKWYIALIIVSLAIILMLVKLNYNKNRKYNTLYKTYEETLQKIEWEKNKLTDVKVKNEELRRVVNKRLKSINNLMAIKIRGEEFDYESLDKELNDIHDNQADFLASLREFFQGYYGDFLGDNIDPPLTITELNYLSLLSIGLNTRDVAAYLKIKAIYNITYRIRKKLGLPADVTNLSDYLQMQFSNS
ncbi:MAG: hypothetical protein K2M31_06165 [Muribaculaceae bacterium]|nr:hypothetical protein [Muribaculaceae bacterium]